MHNRFSTILIFTLATCSPSFAASSISLEIGQFKHPTGDPVFSGVWLLVLDSAGIGSLPGDIAATSASPDAQLTVLNSIATARHFSGVTLSANEFINGSRILGIGNITSESDPDFGGGFGISDAIEFVDGEYGKAYGVYWIPGYMPDDTLPTSGTFEIGGIFRTTTTEFSPRGTFAPPDLTAFESAVFGVSDINAITVTAIPEPSTFLLSTLGAIALLRRSRKS